jgi:acetyltransferase
MDARDTSSPADVTLRDGTCVIVRPIRPDDEPLMAVFHAGLSARSVYQRYFHVSSLEQRITHQRLALTCHVDPAAGAAVVAELVAPDGRRAILAMGRLTRTAPESAEIALLVVDRCQGIGLGSAMMRRILDDARRIGIRRLHGEMLADNDAMRALVRRAGFVVRTVPGDAAVLRAELTLTGC